MKKMILVLLISHLIFNCYSQNPQTNVFFEECVKVFADEYGLHKREEINLKNNLSIKEYFCESNLKKSSFLLLKSKKLTEPYTYSWIRIIVYEYSNNFEAESCFQNLDSMKDDKGIFIFDKDRDYAVLLNKYIIRLDGGCSFSQNPWDKLKLDFLSALKKTFGNKIEKTIECKCGGSCF